MQPQHMSYGMVSHQSPYEATSHPPMQQTQHHILTNTSTYPPLLGCHTQQIIRMSSTSEEESDDMQATNIIPWQQATSTKRKKITRKANIQEVNLIPTNNRYSILTVEENNHQDTEIYIYIRSHRLSKNGSTIEKLLR
jgi:hypothetical protein